MQSRYWKLCVALFAFALVAASCGSNSVVSDVTDTVTDAADEVADTAGDAAEAVEDAVTDDEPEEEAMEEEPEEEAAMEEEAMEEEEEAMEEDAMADAVDSLSGINVIDDLTMEVTLKAPDPEFPLRLAYSGFAPVPKAFLDDPVAFEAAPIGNGPFMMDGEWEHDVQIRLVPNPNYPGPAPQIDSLTFNIYEDVTTTGYLDLQAGIVDVAENIPPDQLAIAPDVFGDRYAESAQTSFYYYGFPSYLNDQYPLELRQALSMSVDRELIIDAILDGTKIPAASAVPGSLAGAQDVACNNWTFDPDGARAAFEAFGGVDALGDDPIIVWHNTSETHASIAEAVTNQWRAELGIENVTFENLEFSEYLPLLDEQGVTGPFRLGWGADYLSPLNFLEPLYASYSAPPSGSNSSFYNNPDFDQALADGKEAFGASGDLADAIPFYQSAETMLCEDVGILPIYFGENQYVWNDTVEGVYKDAFSNINWEEISGGDVTGAIGEPEHLSPPFSNESEGIEVLETLYRNLVEYDHRTAVAELVVAESIETTDGGQTWMITLNDGWTFHNGEAVTAQSFADSWNYSANGANAAGNNYFMGVFEGFDALNEG